MIWEQQPDIEWNPDTKKYHGKMKFELVLDTSLFDEWFESLTEQEKTDYYNKQCKKGESEL